MSLLEDKANQIIADAKGNLPTVIFDVATIAAVISVIVQVVKLYQACKNTPEQTKVAMESPNLFHRWRLRRMVRQSLFNSNSDKTVNEVMNSMLNQGKTVSIDDVSRLYIEADNYNTQQEVSV